MNNLMHSARIARRGAALAAAVAVAFTTLLPATPVFAHGPRTIPAGTNMRLRVETPIRSNAVRPGSEFAARVIQPINVDGEDAVPSGTMIIGTVTGVTQPRGFGQPSGVTLLINSMRSPLGVSVNVVGDLADLNGNSFTTVENLNSGTEILFRTARSLVVPEEFYKNDDGGGEPQGDDIFDTLATVRQAQIVLRDLGYYTGNVDGRLTPTTRASIGLFQRDQRLRQTGFLDRETIDRLGLISQSGQEVQAVTVLSADAQLHQNNQLHIRMVTQAPSLGWQIFEDHFRQRDTLHVYVRGFRPSGPSGQAVQSKELNVTLDDADWRGLTKIVVHSAGRDITITANNFTGGETGGSFTATESAALEARITRMLTDYARVLGIRYNPLNGQLLMTRANYRENEIELLFALNGLASSARLYTQIIRSTDDPQAIEGATDLYVAQASIVDRAVQRTRTGRAANVARGWAVIRDEFAQIESGDNINREGVGYRP